MGQCCGTDSRSESDEQYSRTDRRPGSSTHSSTYDPKSMPKQHIGFEEGTPSPPLPPPLVPDSKAVYDLLEGEHEEVCPTCLEEYTNENPRMTSMCQHTFHLVRNSKHLNVFHQNVKQLDNCVFLTVLCVCWILIHR